jgi:hypothetical protein
MIGMCRLVLKAVMVPVLSFPNDESCGFVDEQEAGL